MIANTYLVIADTRLQFWAPISINELSSNKSIN